MYMEGKMFDFEKTSYEEFKKQICPRCEIAFQLRRRESVLSSVLEKYTDVEKESAKDDVVYQLGTEGVREVFRTSCVYVDKCDEIKESISTVDELENRLSKLLYYMMNNNLEREVYYTSSDINPYYPMLFNRIIRCNRSKESVLSDKCDTKNIIEKFSKKINN